MYKSELDKQFEQSLERDGKREPGNRVIEPDGSVRPAEDNGFRYKPKTKPDAPQTRP